MPVDVAVQLTKVGFLALHLPCGTNRIFHWIASALPKRVRTKSSSRRGESRVSDRTRNVPIAVEIGRQASIASGH